MKPEFALNLLQGMLNTLTGNIAEMQGQADALTVSIGLLTEGYKTDQAWIDGEIQAAKDATAAQITQLTTDLATANATIAQIVAPGDPPA